MNFLSDFGINPILLAAQVVNFFILLFILKKFLYAPILKVLANRRKKIEDSLKNVEEIERRMQEMTEREAQSILKSAREGEKIIKEASDYAVSLIEDGKKEYENLINKGVEDAKKLAQVQKEMIMQQAKESLGDLVALVFEKVTGKKVTERDQREIIEKEIKNLS